MPLSIKSINNCHYCYIKLIYLIWFQSVMNMMHVISIPYSLMKVNPLSWIQKVCQYKGKEQDHLKVCLQVKIKRTNCWYSYIAFTWCIRNLPIPVAAKVACVKSRDMHWALVAHRDQRDINLSSLRMLIVADGANPCKWCFCSPSKNRECFSSCI